MAEEAGNESEDTTITTGHEEEDENESLSITEIIAKEKEKISASERKRAQKQIDKLMAEVKKERGTRQELQTLLGDVDLDELKEQARLYREAEEKKLEEQGLYKEQMAKQKEMYEGKLADERKAREAAELATRNLTVKTTVGAALATLRIRPQQIGIVEQYLGGKVEIVEGELLIEGEEAGKWITETWPDTAEGKSFLLPADTKGGGASNDGTGNGAEDPDAKFFKHGTETWSMAEQTRVYKSGPDGPRRYAELMKAFGPPDDFVSDWQKGYQ